MVLQLVDIEDDVPALWRTVSQSRARLIDISHYPLTSPSSLLATEPGISFFRSEQGMAILQKIDR